MTVLVLGILSLVCCGPLGFVAWLTGNSVLQEIDAQPGRYANRTVVQVGRVLGMLGVGIFALAAFFWVVGTFSSS